MQIVVEKPKISTVVDSCNDSIHSCYKNTIEQILRKILPEKLFFSDAKGEHFTQKQLSYMNDFLPLVKWIFPENGSEQISVILICRHRLNATSFFYDIVSRFLIPHKQLNIDVFFSADFRLPELIPTPLTAAEISIRIQDLADLEQIKVNYRSIETEIRLGVASNYHANRILEFKGLSTDGKTAMIQEKIGALVQSGSKEFDQTIVTQMQQFLVNCQEEFKSVRDYHHISRIISVMHTVRKLLNQKIQAFKNQRHLMVKFLKTKIKISGEEKAVLGIMVGLNFLHKREIFEKSHLIRAVKEYIPNIRAIENSFFLERNKDNTIQSVYLEVEKEEGSDFSFDEVKLLRKALPEHLKGCIEHLMHPVFMPRNEEEVFRSIMTLSKQLKYVNDLPQVIVSFEEQTQEELVFMVVLLRVLNKKSESIQKLLARKDKETKFILERNQKVGTLRKRYCKEANVFKVVVGKNPFYRLNLTLDLHKARRHVVSKLNERFGDIRDYNGGMIHKQTELLEALKVSLGSLNLQNGQLLEKFFFSITPVEMRSILTVEPLKGLFTLLMSHLKRKSPHLRKVVYKQQEKAIYILVFGLSPKQIKVLQGWIAAQHLPSHMLVHSYFDPQEIPLQGFIYFSEDEKEQMNFLKTMKQCLDF